MLMVDVFISMFREITISPPRTVQTMTWTTSTIDLRPGRVDRVRDTGVVIQARASELTEQYFIGNNTHIVVYVCTRWYYNRC